MVLHINQAFLASIQIAADCDLGFRLSAYNRCITLGVDSKSIDATKFLKFFCHDFFSECDTVLPGWGGYTDGKGFASVAGKLRIYRYDCLYENCRKK